MSSEAPGRESAVEVNGVRLWTARHGEGPPLVLLHGGPGLYDYFDELAEMFDDLVEVHRYDQRGGGRSGRTPPYDIATFVSDLDALRQHWGHERWIVAGHSFGAALAVAYAIAFPGRVSALAYISGSGVIEDWSEEYHENAAARLSPAQRERWLELRSSVIDGSASSELVQEYNVLCWMPDYADRDRAREFAERLLRPYGPSYDVNRAVGEDWKRTLADGSFAERVREIAAPVLVLHGAEDPRPPRLAERLAASLPNARLEIIPDAGHVPWLERPDAVRDIVRDFLSQVARETVAEGAVR